MRVLQIINSLDVGGAEKLLIESLPFFESKIQVDVVILTSKNNYLRGSLNENDFQGQILELSNGSVYSPKLIFSLKSIIAKYDVIHVHLFPALYWTVFASLTIKSKIKIVYTEHSTNNKRRRNFLFRLIDRFVYNKLDKIISISDDVDYELKNHLQSSLSKKIVKIENGINLAKIKAALPYPKTSFFSELDVILMQVSSFRFPKDHITLIDSLSLLPEKYKLLLVGDGPLLKDVKLYVNEMKLEGRVMFLGLRNDIPKLLKTADVIILSSAYEGLSLSSIEGMCSGKPFIASDVKGLSQIVRSYGLLFEFKNAKDLTSKVLDSVEDINLREIIIQNCLVRANQFDINTMVSKYIDLYKKL